MSQCINAFSQDEQRRVDVSCLFKALSFVLSFGASLGAGQVAQTQPDGPHIQRYLEFFPTIPLMNVETMMI